MQIAMYYSNSDVRLEEMAIPEISPDEILVKVIVCGICGSDVMEWYRIHKVPLVLGHEIAGEVAKTGSGVRHLKEGDRVVVAHHVPCNECRYCRSGHHTVCDTLRSTNVDPGGFAQYIRVPAINVDRGLFSIPEGVSFERASFAEALACVLRGQRLLGVEPGATVLVMGSGISGLLHIKMALVNGADRVISTEISQYRKDAALRAGVEEVIDGGEDVPERVKELNGGKPADIVIVTAGAEKSVTDALASIDRAGKVLLFAPTAQGVEIPVSLNDIFWRNEVTLMSSYGGSPEDYDLALRLISNGTVEVEDLITHRLSLAEAGEGFKLVERADQSIKVIIEPWKE